MLFSVCTNANSVLRTFFEVATCSTTFLRFFLRKRLSFVHFFSFQNHEVLYVRVGAGRLYDGCGLRGDAPVGQGRGDIHERGHPASAEHAADTAERSDPQGPRGRWAGGLRVHTRLAAHQPVRDPRRSRAPRGGQQPADPSRPGRQTVNAASTTSDRPPRGHSDGFAGAFQGYRTTPHPPRKKYFKTNSIFFVKISLYIRFRPPILSVKMCSNPPGKKKIENTPLPVK